MSTRGVYFLANDYMLEFVIAFLNSFRMYNPELPLCLIPFNNHVDGILGLQSTYQFKTWKEDELLGRCDLISRRFHDAQIMPQYRKLAMWQGPYDDFVCIDVDTVVLSNVSFAFEFLSYFTFITSHSHLPEGRTWVWKDSIYDLDALTPSQIAFSANTGFIVSRKHALTLDDAERALPDALRLVNHMELLCAEQPFLNYLIVTSPHRYSSLLVIRRFLGLSKVPVERWAGNFLGDVNEGRVVDPANVPVLLVHWAGEWRKLAEGRLPNAELWEYYRYRRNTGNLHTPADVGSDEHIA